MFKRAMMVGVLCLSLLTTLGSQAEAHLAGYQTINGYLRHVSSFDCGIKIKGVSNLDQHPAVFECAVTITRVESLCENPANHDVNPGEAATQVRLVAQGEVDNGDITDKKKGRAEKFVTFEDAELLNDEFCVNPNWHNVDVLVTEVTAELKTFACTGPDIDPCNDSDLVLAYIEELDCVLPPEFDIADNPPPAGTLYTCSLISKEHVD